MPTFTLSGRVTVSMRPLSGTVTTSLPHPVWDCSAAALTVTFITPAETYSHTQTDRHTHTHTHTHTHSLTHTNQIVSLLNGPRWSLCWPVPRPLLVTAVTSHGTSGAGVGS